MSPLDPIFQVNELPLQLFPGTETPSTYPSPQPLMSEAAVIYLNICRGDGFRLMLRIYMPPSARAGRVCGGETPLPPGPMAGSAGRAGRQQAWSHGGPAASPGGSRHGASLTQGPHFGRWRAELPGAALQRMLQGPGTCWHFKSCDVSVVAAFSVSTDGKPGASLPLPGFQHQPSAGSVCLSGSK